jgi:hypothetical membrane protein
MRNVLLTGGIIAGPLYLIVGLIQAFTRPGFDITRHPLSVLSNGDLGWIQITNFVVSGLLVSGAAIGIRQSLLNGRGRTWGPLLVGLYGLSLIGAAIFKADPALGFPAGTPLDQNTVTTTGILHFVSGGIGFLALIVGCFVFARRFAAAQQRGWQIFSVLTGIVFLAAFVGIGAGAGNPWTILGFWIGLTVAWAWLSLLCARLRRPANM